MYEVRTASARDLDAVLELITRLQCDPAHHVGYHGETPEEVAEELTGPFPAGTVVAVDSGGRLRGVLTVSLSSDTAPASVKGFALHGPFVDVPAHHPAAGQVWQATADALLAASGVDGPLELCGHRGNRLLADFAARHDVPVRRSIRRRKLTGAPLRGLLVRCAGADDRVVPLPDDPRVRAAVTRLHDTCFPATQLTGDHTVVVLLGSDVLGYAAGRPRATDHIVDAVAVTPEARSCGVGRTLVRRLLAELTATSGPRNRATAAIPLPNDAAEHMFAKLDFDVHTELVHYR